MQTKMESSTVVLYPDPTIGHLVSMVELGKLIHTHHPSLSIIILIIPTPDSTTSKYINTVSTTTPSITFHHLPTNVVPPDFSSNHLDRAFGVPELYNPFVHHTLITISEKSTIKGVILDFFTNAAFQVFKNLHLPTYYFHTGGASLLSVFLNIPAIQTINDSNAYFDVPGVPPIHASDLPQIILLERNMSTKHFLNTSINMANSSGIILNTFLGFEERAEDTLRDGKCIQNGVTPPVYLVGPLIAQADPTENECLKWLDSQPSKSVVFLCFGSMGVLSKKQLREIAIGLEKSGQRFLWVVRDPPLDGSDLKDFYPEGFLTRTRDKGLVVKNWAPQQAILSHGSVGGFVSHCGWNSILESVVAGVPMVAWPLYAEQKLNRVYLVKELKVAVEVKMSADDFVTAEAVEEKVRELMVGEEGEMVRERALEMSRRAKAAVDEGGCSRVELFKLTQPWVAQ
ncbi:putative UDP-glucuronosyl/UDP-glucosyltransferase, UDP-glycosyltransferase family [Helianthus annuus]|uniref:Glycosyltransferase n=1 Tax=Helianthus annuus TaxID=4232 RepID=A0A9K3HAM0_HELAN|nr:UDP-glycosyltransferase 88B1 [Helianthus annuus]KAF5771399.1 putative UDP-glucuronosyl/UDP-glucosyltransferase, UDP-glycosyltransferase family [Helianthus annuus]KAJ0466250.1 putative UDP-glucuronosyl/UDP-glucosyltransferase, UDP-glycosyltransferase family [Helianthus annuus]KAJ0471254.1 putative UDP-glucuronosyl/UDP-glucosyltransferase, UDP-glycosyltransferase family [Helianthus annuus]KAJ0487808.1 putative UDP-glucuronosyl/UDP-glucosyltransferase, UDP-glycosyltransferase family [Helianthus